MNKKIGFIGVGTMGDPMARNLLRKGYIVQVYDIIKDRVEAMAQAGAIATSSPKEAALGADVVITMLPSSPHVEQAVLGKNGILEGLKQGAVYIDMSTIDPITTRNIAKAVSGKGVSMLDAPVTKGVSSAIDGTLNIFIGGRKEVFEEVKDVLMTMGSTFHHMGDIGAGSMTKLINNLILATIVASTAEGFVLGAKAGVDPDKLCGALAGGTADSFALKKHIKEYALKRKFDEVMFPVDFIMKDLGLAGKTAKELNFPLLIGNMIHEIYAMLKAKGRGKGYYTEVITLFEDYAGVNVQSKA